MNRSDVEAGQQDVGVQPGQGEQSRISSLLVYPLHLHLVALQIFVHGPINLLLGFKELLLGSFLHIVEDGLGIVVLPVHHVDQHVVGVFGRYSSDQLGSRHHHLRMGQLRTFNYVVPVAGVLRNCLLQQTSPERVVLGERHSCEGVGVVGAPTKSQVLEQSPYVFGLPQFGSEPFLLVKGTHSHLLRLLVDLVEK